MKAGSIGAVFSFRGRTCAVKRADGESDASFERRVKRKLANFCRYVRRHTRV